MTQKKPPLIITRDYILLPIFLTFFSIFINHYASLNSQSTLALLSYPNKEFFIFFGASVTLFL